MSVAVAIGHSLEAALRAGFSVRQALGRAAADHPELRPVADVPPDAPMDEVLRRWQAAMPDADSALYVAAVRLQLEDHGNLADTWGVLTRILERRG